MSENKILDLVMEVTIQRYELEELDWSMQSFNDGAKTISVGLYNPTTGAKLRASYDREDIRFEEMKRWDDNKKLLYVKELDNLGMELPPQLVEYFAEAVAKLELDPEALPQIPQAEESPEEFEAKVEGKKKLKRKQN